MSSVLCQSFRLLDTQLTVVLIEVDFNRFGLLGELAQFQLLQLSLHSFVAITHVYLLLFGLVLS